MFLEINFILKDTTQHFHCFSTHDNTAVQIDVKFINKASTAYDMMR